MRPWTIALSSAIGTIVVLAALAVPEVINAPRSEIGTLLLRHFPALAVGALGVYGLGAMLLTTTTLVAGMLRLRQYLARAAPGRAPTRHDWIAALGGSGLRQPATRSARARAETIDDVVDPTPLTANEARSEIARRLYISLARCHFLSVLIVLLGIVALGVAQDHGSLPFQSGTIPTVSAILIVAGLVLLAVLGRIAIDVTAEPLLETRAQLPAEFVQVELLRHVVALLETARRDPTSDDRTSEPARLPERLVAAFEQGHRSLLDAVGRLSENSQALEAAMRTSVEVLETTINSAAALHRLGGDERSADALSFPELQAAVEELTAVLRRLSTVSEPTEEITVAGEIVPPQRKAPAPGLALELRRLLQEIDAGR
jgi:hypothetical protein